MFFMQINSDIKHSVLNPIVEFHRRWKYFGSVAYQITVMFFNLLENLNFFT